MSWDLGSSRRSALPALLALAALGWPGPAGAFEPPEPRATAAKRGPLVRTTFDTKGLTRRLPRSFVGFGFEYSFIFPHLGRPEIGIYNDVFLRFMDTIAAARSGPAPLRIGGNTGDGAWWNPNSLPNPEGIFFSIRPWMADAMRKYSERTGAPFVIGLNLAKNDPQVAIDWATAARAALPPGAIQAFEVGNEPDFFPTRPFTDDRLTRPRNYSFRDYLREFGRFARALRRAIPGIPLAGPSACCYTEYDAGLPALLRRQARRLRLVTYHWYFLNGCDIVSKSRPGARRRRLGVRMLLDDEQVNRQAARYGNLARFAQRRGVNMRMTEIGSGACQPLPGIGNSGASALWAADWLFSLFAYGVDGVNFFSAGGPHPPFEFGYTGNGFVGIANPSFLGIRAFAEATANRARLLYNTIFRTRVRRGARVRLWPTLDRFGTGRVLLVNKSGRRGGRVRIRVPGRSGPGRVAYLRMPGLYATKGVSWAGQAYSVPTDGRPQGERRETRVRKRRGAYSFHLPPASVALLTIPNAR